MRVIAGTLGGRLFEAPKGHRTHPMSEKIRGAIFNALGDITGLTVLDAFTGSGALCFEAISRGAKNATGIDMDKGAYTIATKNADALGLRGKVKITGAYADSWSTRHQNDLFDIVLLDPPYSLLEIETVERLALHTKPGGIAVFSLPPKARLILPAGQFKQLNFKEYGDASVYYYRRVGLSR